MQSVTLCSGAGWQMTQKSSDIFRYHHLIKISSPRVLSAIISAGIFAFLLRYLDTNSFVEIQIVVSMSGVLLWITDFGLTNQSMVEIGNINFGLGRKLALYRLGSVLFFLMVVIFFYLTGTDNPDGGIIFSAVVIDLLTDSFLNLRLTINQSHLSKYSLVYKKIFQLLLLFIFAIEKELDIDRAAVSLLFPALLLMFFDFRWIKKLKKDYSNFQFKKSFKNWIQSGGTAITGFDYLIIGPNQLILIQIISVARKVANFITVPIQSVIPETASRSIHNLQLSELSENEKSSFLAVSFISLFCAIFINPALSIFFEIELLNRERLLLVLMILIVPIGSLTYLNNLKLLKYGCFKQLIWINWVSSISYLVALIIGSKNGNIFWCFGIGIILNTFLELLGQRITFRKIENYA